MRLNAMLMLGAIALGASGCTPPGPAPASPTATSQPRPGVVMPPRGGDLGHGAGLHSAGVEVTGARCALSSPYSTAEFVAPASVAVPDFGPSSPVIEVACAQGGAKGRVAVQPTLRSTNGGLGGVPAIGVSVGTGTGGGGGVSVGGFWGGGFGTTGPSVQQTIYPEAHVILGG